METTEEEAHVVPGVVRGVVAVRAVASRCRWAIDCVRSSQTTSPLPQEEEEEVLVEGPTEEVEAECPTHRGRSPRCCQHVRAS